MWCIKCSTFSGWHIDPLTSIPSYMRAVHEGKLLYLVTWRPLLLLLLLLRFEGIIYKKTAYIYICVCVDLISVYVKVYCLTMIPLGPAGIYDIFVGLIDILGLHEPLLIGWNIKLAHTHTHNTTHFRLNFVRKTISILMIKWVHLWEDNYYVSCFPFDYIRLHLYSLMSTVNWCLDITRYLPSRQYLPQCFTVHTHAYTILRMAMWSPSRTCGYPTGTWRLYANIVTSGNELNKV